MKTRFICRNCKGVCRLEIETGVLDPMNPRQCIYNWLTTAREAKWELEQEESLPKLTAEIFNHPDCPKWAKTAAVNADGTAAWWSGTYVKTFMNGWICYSSMPYDWRPIPGKFDATGWEYSLIKRPSEVQQSTTKEQENIKEKVMGNETSVGVVVARFQVAELTEGHKEILDFVLSKGYNLNIVILGIAPTKATKNNPLDFDSRRRMIEEEYPGKFMITYQKDEPDDHSWSENLDSRIEEIAGSNREVVLYGSRDSFGKYYHGKFRFEEYKQRLFCSGTEQRALAGKQVKASKDWRTGCLYATQNRYPTAYPTVDCAIFDDYYYDYIYLAKKKKDKLLRFVGGFVDPSDNSLEEAAIRESKEETGLNTKVISYVCSKKVDDWRYRSEEDKIITSLFVLQKIKGSAVACDDIEEIHRVLFSDIKATDIIEEHRPLFYALAEWRTIQKGKI